MKTESMLIRGKTGFIVAKILSDSMMPILCRGEFVLIKKISASGLKRGMLAAFISNRQIPLIHRVITVSKTHIQTVADNNQNPDPIIKAENFIGIVTMIKINREWKIYENNKILTLLGISIASLSHQVTQCTHKRFPLLLRGIMTKASSCILKM